MKVPWLFQLAIDALRRSRTPSPVTTGASTQALDTFEERQPVGQADVEEPSQSRSPSPSPDKTESSSQPAGQPPKEEMAKPATKGENKRCSVSEEPRVFSRKREVDVVFVSSGWATVVVVSVVCARFT